MFGAKRVRRGRGFRRVSARARRPSPRGRKSLSPFQSRRTGVPGSDVPNPLEAARQNKIGRGTDPADGGKRLKRRNAKCGTVDPAAVPLFPPSQPRFLICSGLRDPVPAKPALFEEHPVRTRVPWRAHQTQGTGGESARDGPRAQVRSKRLQKEFGVSPQATQARTRPRGRELCPSRVKVTQVALPDPKTPLPLSSARLRLPASPDPGRQHPQLGCAFSSPPRLPVFPGHWGPLGADLRPSPTPLARPWSRLKR